MCLFSLSQTSFYLRRCFFLFIWRTSLQTLSVNRCLHLISSSAVIRPSFFDLASSFTCCQMSSLFIILSDASTSTHQLAILRDNLKLTQKGTQHFVCFFKKMMKDKCLWCLFKIEGVKHKTLDLSRSYILTTPKFI